jgi:hypothetical protein
MLCGRAEANPASEDFMTSTRAWFLMLASLASIATNGCVVDEEVLGQVEAPLLNSGQTIRASNGLCLDTYYGEGAEGTAAMMWTCHAQGMQQWSAFPTGRIQAANGRCLNVPYPTSSNPYVDVATCADNANQRWTFETANGWELKIRGWGGRCLTRGGPGLGEGVFLRPCDGSAEQVWSTTTWVIVNSVDTPSECWSWIDYIPGSGSFLDNQYKLGTNAYCSDPINFEANGGAIHWYDPGFCVEALKAGGWPGIVPDNAQIWVKRCSGASNQSWTWSNYALRTVNNRCITRVPTSSGITELRARTCNGSAAQKWVARHQAE